MFCLSEYLVIIFIMIYHNLGPLLLNQHRWQKSAPCWAGHREIVSTDSDEVFNRIYIRKINVMLFLSFTNYENCCFPNI